MVQQITANTLQGSSLRPPANRELQEIYKIMHICCFCWRAWYVQSNLKKNPKIQKSDRNKTVEKTIRWNSCEYGECKNWGENTHEIMSKIIEKHDQNPPNLIPADGRDDPPGQIRAGRPKTGSPNRDLPVPGRPPKSEISASDTFLGPKESQKSVSVALK